MWYDWLTWLEGAMTDSPDTICYIMKVVLPAVSVYGHQMEAEDFFFLRLSNWSAVSVPWGGHLCSCLYKSSTLRIMQSRRWQHLLQSVVNVHQWNPLIQLMIHEGSKAASTKFSYLTLQHWRMSRILWICCFNNFSETHCQWKICW